MHLNDLLRLDGPPFIKAAYLAILKREVDPSGMGHFMERLAAGDGKEAVIVGLAISPEADGSRVDVAGLRLLVKRRRKSVLKRVVSWLFDIAPTRRQIARIEHMIAVQNQEFAHELGRLREMCQSLADVQAAGGRPGWSGDAVRDTLQSLQQELANTAHDPKVVIERLQSVIRSSALPHMLGC